MNYSELVAIYVDVRLLTDSEDQQSIQPYVFISPRIIYSRMHSGTEL